MMMLTSGARRVTVLWLVFLTLLLTTALWQGSWAAPAPFFSPQDTPSPTPPPPPTATPEGYRGWDGGDFVSADGGFEVNLPTGYLPNGAIITGYSLTKGPAVQGYTIVGAPYCFAAWVSGRVTGRFDKAITLGIRYDLSAGLTEAQQRGLRLAFYSQDGSGWVMQPSTVDLAARIVRTQTTSVVTSTFCDAQHPDNRQTLVALVLPAGSAAAGALTPTGTRPPGSPTSTATLLTATGTRALASPTTEATATAMNSPTAPSSRTASPAPSGSATAAPALSERPTASPTPTPLAGGGARPGTAAYTALYVILVVLAALVGVGAYLLVRRK